MVRWLVQIVGNKVGDLGLPSSGHKKQKGRYKKIKGKEEVKAE